MDNPYTPAPADNASQPSFLKTTMQRVGVFYLYTLVWALIGMLLMSFIRRFGGDAISMQTPEAELTIAQSFTRFCESYWFTAYFLSLPVCFLIWLILKRRGKQKTRWTLMVIGIAIVPEMLVLAWLLFRPLLFV